MEGRLTHGEDEMESDAGTRWLEPKPKPEEMKLDVALSADVRGFFFSA